MRGLGSMRQNYGKRLSHQRGFSLIELIVCVAILMLVIGVAVKGLTDMQQIDFSQHEKTDTVQETRDFIDQMVRDLHDVGYPPRAVFPNRPNCGTNPAIACTLVFYDNKNLRYEGDLDGTGTVFEVIISLQPGPGGTCPCILQRGAIQKSLYLGGTQPAYYTELNGVLNSGDGAGNSTYGVNLPGSGSYSSYATADVFDGYDVTATPVASCTSATACSAVASIQITVNAVPKYADQKTHTFPVYSITSKARVNNQQSDE
jgi:prepilin-type N-terminal cleavage/methylation domain-containing protein